jgi:hypothetical protein
MPKFPMIVESLPATSRFFTRGSIRGGRFRRRCQLRPTMREAKLSW